MEGRSDPKPIEIASHGEPVAVLAVVRAPEPRLVLENVSARRLNAAELDLAGVVDTAIADALHVAVRGSRWDLVEALAAELRRREELRNHQVGQAVAALIGK